MKVGTDTVALVTGASSGIGFGIAQAIAATGARVYLADLDETTLASAVERLGARATGVVLDVRDRARWATVVDDIQRTEGGIDLLVNNAGVGFLTPSIEASFEQWDWVLDINLTGVYNGIRSVVPGMLERGTPAHVVATASIGGLLATSGGAYAAAKFGVVGLMESLATELLGTDVGVSILAPGIVRTNIAHGLKPPGDASGVQPGGAEHADSLYRQPMEPGEVGQRVVDAVSADALYVLTHGEHRQFLERRFDAILRSLPTETPPAPRAAVEALILDNSVYDAVRLYGTAQ